MVRLGLPAAGFASETAVAGNKYGCHCSRYSKRFKVFIVWPLGTRQPGCCKDTYFEFRIAKPPRT
ncbi:hypothetical protein D1627_08790 [Pontibacter oryzae]|uniref:Uncharacterized protein n=1 Tax=Pontibacter oryzae TaxID=2304593 RepID=A0A399RZ76_9BACT|nr:hypothetical protein D1627_08790 [Pontibacter oryzae]